MRKSSFITVGLSASVLIGLSGLFTAATAQADPLRPAAVKAETVQAETEIAAARNCIDAAKVIRNHFGIFDVAAHHNAVRAENPVQLR